jgi:hypothetical protein
MEKIVGLYIHQHWPYRHPYAARTWTLPDWRGWAEGLQRLGYNTLLIWPMLETMPDPLTPSDRAHLTKLGQVIDHLHDALGMRAYIVLCPNIAADNAEASRVSFEDRHYYYCDRLVNPGDPAALDALVRWREELLRPLARVDAVAIIDSDPGCYPGSSNREFVELLAAHRRMFDRLRPGREKIELIYWMHAGWRGWSRFYETGQMRFGTPEEHRETLGLLAALDPEPWGMANGLEFAQERGLASKVISFNYGRIEGEPSFPMTNFGGDAAYEGGRSPGPRGVMGNAQTHCVQLPNIYAFARGSAGQPLTDADYARFADDLVPGHGEAILHAWKTLAAPDPEAMRAEAERLEQTAAGELPAGPLQGLLFGSPARFFTDLAQMLRLRAARDDLAAATEAGQGVRERLQEFLAAAEAWQGEHGYQNYWHDPRLHAALATLRSPEIDAALRLAHEAKEPFDPGVHSPMEQVRRNFRAIETYTPRLLAAARAALGGRLADDGV